MWVLSIAHALGEGTDAGRLWFLAAAGIVIVPAALLLAVRHLPSSPTGLLMTPPALHPALLARRARVRRIRARVAAGATALFLAAFSGLYVQMATGHDPALGTSTAQVASRHKPRRHRRRRRARAPATRSR